MEFAVPRHYDMVHGKRTSETTIARTSPENYPLDLKQRHGALNIATALPSGQFDREPSPPLLYSPLLTILSGPFEWLPRKRA